MEEATSFHIFCLDDGNINIKQACDEVKVVVARKGTSTIYTIFQTDCHPKYPINKDQKNVRKYAKQSCAKFGSEKQAFASKNLPQAVYVKICFNDQPYRWGATWAYQ